MSRPHTKRLMERDEFNLIVEKLTFNADGWLDRIHDLTAIDKPTLKKYASGDRQIPNAHALFLRQKYYLQVAYPDLANDIMVLIRSAITDHETLPSYKDIAEKAELQKEIKNLNEKLKKIANIAIK